MNRAVFLDIDGTLVATIDGHGPRRAHEIEYLPEVESGCYDLKKAGLLLIGITNQPDLARGKMDKNQWFLVRNAIMHACRLDDVFWCPHDNQDGCCCRKPKPGLIYAAAYEHDIHLASSFLIGNEDRDILAGIAIGRTILIGKGFAGDYQCKTFRQAADCVLQLASKLNMP